MAFVTRRRFGHLGLALAAGVVLSMTWSGTLTPLLEKQGITLVSPSLSLVVQGVLIILPAIVMLLNGPTYNVLWQRLLGSAAFAVLGFVFLLEPLSSIFEFEGLSYTFVNFVAHYTNFLIVLGIIGAVADSLLTSPQKHKDRSHKH